MDAPNSSTARSSKRARELDWTEAETASKKSRQLAPSLDDDPSTWHPGGYISPASGRSHPYTLLILNVPLEHGALPEIISKASYMICADGGANRLREAQLKSNHPEAQSWLPDVIHGDLDSLHDDVRRFYEKRNVSIIRDRDQNSTDLTKCLKYVSKRQRDQHESGLAGTDPPRSDIVVLGSLSGRIDQAFATLQPLITASHPPRLLPNGEVILITPQSIAFMLRPGEHRIHTPLSQASLAQSVGIIPLGEPARITTSGLEWDVTNWQTQLGGKVSTSNHIKADVLTVHVELPEGAKGAVMFTVELAGGELSEEESGKQGRSSITYRTPDTSQGEEEGCFGTKRREETDIG